MENLNQLMKARMDKLDRIRQAGIDPYPVKTTRTHNVGQVLENKEQLLQESPTVTISGRIGALRRMGKIGFADIADETGRIQVYLRRDEIPQDDFALFKMLDLGDFIQVSGVPFITQTGQYSVKAQQIVILTKALRPLPTVKQKEVDGQLVRYDELADVELRYRKRYLDLLLNPESKKVFETRGKILAGTRMYLYEQGFTEVETPILQPLYGGANARPFTTHHNTLDIDLYMRIALELYLKRLIVGGFEKVFEIGKNFRNEGMDRLHNPEFTMLELYQAWSDYIGMMDLTEGLIKYLANTLQLQTIEYAGHNIDLTKPFERVSMIELIKRHTGFDASDFDEQKLADFCKEHKIERGKSDGPGKMISNIFEAMVEEKLIQPTFVIDHPLEISPLAKKKPGHPLLVERFELFIGGGEFANAFSELNDPVDQRARFEAQVRLREAGDDEAQQLDEDFLQALEYGMPPTGGLGIGIDRLVMLLTGSSTIKDVLLFPQMKTN